MSKHEWVMIPICNSNYDRILAPRIVIGGYCVGPSLINDCEFTEDHWTVDHVKTGLGLAFYTNFDVALNFARMMEREFGNIDMFAERVSSGQSTDSDKTLAQAIRDRRKHECYLEISFLVDATLFNQSRY